MSEFRFTTLIAKEEHFVEVAKSNAVDVASIIESALREAFPQYTVCTDDRYEPKNLDAILAENEPF